MCVGLGVHEGKQSHFLAIFCIEVVALLLPWEDSAALFTCSKGCLPSSCSKVGCRFPQTWHVCLTRQSRLLCPTPRQPKHMLFLKITSFLSERLIVAKDLQLIITCASPQPGHPCSACDARTLDRKSPNTNSVPYLLGSETTKGREHFP